MLNNMLTDRVFPVVTASRSQRWLSFPEIFSSTLNSGDPDLDPVVDFDWPRADLNTASYELAVGILSLVHPMDEVQWAQAWREGLVAQQLQTALEFHTQAFEIFGEDGAPSFMQSFEPLSDKSPNSVDGLFVDSAGESTARKNADLLTHRNRFGQLSIPAAAMALYALQQFAPSGGAGNRTSMRGGGPLTTLIVAQGPDGAPVPLWRRILLNMPRPDQVAALGTESPALALPWCAPTLLSGKAEHGREVHQLDPLAHPMQCFFGTPRRIRLLRGEVEGICHLTGVNGPLVTGFVQEPWGVNYGLWIHPLTPYRRQKEASEPYSVKPKSGRFGYRDWVSVTMGSANSALTIRPANIEALRGRERAMRRDGLSANLRLSGWAMSNMEAITHLSAEQPLYITGDVEANGWLEDLARAFATAGDQVNRILRGAVRDANFAAGAKVDTASTPFQTLQNAFYGETDGAFHDLLQQALTGDCLADEANRSALSRRWLEALRDCALALFDRHAADPLVNPQAMARHNEAAKWMRIALAGGGKSGGALYDELGLPKPLKTSKSAKRTPQKEKDQETPHV